MKIIIDRHIPFIDDRLDSVAQTVFVDQSGFTRELVKDADALLIRTRTRCDESLLKNSAVRLIATATIGMDQIDIPWCREAGIAVENSAGCNAPAVAQYVISSLLHSGFDGSRGPLGIIGYGNIGHIVADWARRSGWNVLVCDPPRRDAGLTDEDYTSLDTVLGESAAVTIHTPMTKDGDYPTWHMIGARELSILRPGAILVNAARGPIVDNRAWVETLRKGESKAVVDTWEGEPHIDMELLGLADTATCHIAGYSSEGKQRATRMVLEAVERHFGVTLNKDGLEGPYKAPGDDYDAKTVMESFNPFAETARLRAGADDFDRIREEYPLRPEPVWKHKTCCHGK